MARLSPRSCKVLFRLCGIRREVRRHRDLSAAGRVFIKGGLAIKRGNAKRAASKGTSSRPASIVTDDVETPDSLVMMSKSAGFGAKMTRLSFGTSSSLRRLWVMGRGRRQCQKRDIVRSKEGPHTNSLEKHGSAGSHDDGTDGQKRKDGVTQCKQGERCNHRRAWNRRQGR
ncbi:hypothetical protein FVEG_17196 [Fusarium verticillioides 7600]|uniref:Uncharacterized protein n=1 Tax=Gibberella moniliformis (strain M3125 / FGSC 7600) TaxID=334819 RepID=W7NBV6_GIBM7|nr:hypothetical protein FVEG_17196 [Fusarium verticillioides 7600]EWG53922.1 hypothetical protein FVEG_17196 [Fusarium verticillioides 7600]